MTFLTRAQAEEACGADLEEHEAADDELNDAVEDLAEARDAYDEAGEFLDDSTAWDVAAGATVAAACLSNPFSWVVCGFGIVAGGAGVIASEADRQDEIDSARDAVERAEERLERAQRDWSRSFREAFGCVIHHMAKGPIEDDDE